MRLVQSECSGIYRRHRLASSQRYFCNVWTLQAKVSIEIHLPFQPYVHANEFLMTNKTDVVSASLSFREMFALDYGKQVVSLQFQEEQGNTNSDLIHGTFFL